jgi:hypothetical protein
MTPSGSLSTALTALAKAVDAAEAAAEARSQATQEQGVAAKDSAALEAALSDLRRDHASLKSVANDVTRRLDGAIDQVESILAGRA